MPYGNKRNNPSNGKASILLLLSEMHCSNNSKKAAFPLGMAHIRTKMIESRIFASQGGRLR
jgi:hypothetical protein